MHLYDAATPERAAIASYDGISFEVQYVGRSHAWATYDWPLYDLLVNDRGAPDGRRGFLSEINATIKEWFPDLPELEWEPMEEKSC